jgi:hypothetical protein
MADKEAIEKSFRALEARLGGKETAKKHYVKEGADTRPAPGPKARLKPETGSGRS